MGESFGLYRIGDDKGADAVDGRGECGCGFPPRISITCGKPCGWRSSNGVAVGLTRRCPNLQGFGRREMAMKREEMANCLIYLIGALKGFLDAEGMVLSHIKPQGSLYGMAAAGPHAKAVCDAADVSRAAVRHARTLHETVYPARGHRFIAEYYADLEYTARAAYRHPIPTGGRHRRCRALRAAIRDRVTRSVAASCANRSGFDLRAFRHAERGGDRHAVRTAILPFRRDCDTAVANRGEIAVRVLRAARALGLRTVAVCSEAMRHRCTSPRLTPPSHRASRPPKAICAPMPSCRRRQAEADAVHPGYGSWRKTGLPPQRRAAGLIFVGPRPEQIEAMGDKEHAPTPPRPPGCRCCRPVNVGPNADTDLAAGRGRRIFACLAGRGRRAHRLRPSQQAIRRPRPRRRDVSALGSTVHGPAAPHPGGLGGLWARVLLSPMASICSGRGPTKSAPLPRRLRRMPRFPPGTHSRMHCIGLALTGAARMASGRR